MNQDHIPNTPALYHSLYGKTSEMGFSMPSDVHVGALLKTLCASKTNGNFLELVTGTGLSLVWILEGMDEHSKITSVDDDSELIDLAQHFFRDEQRLLLQRADAGEWLLSYRGERFDLIFADARPVKYRGLEQALDLVEKGGFYVVDDMKPQPNWPADHQQHMDTLVEQLEAREDFTITKMDWSTGVIVAVKTK